MPKIGPDGRYIAEAQGTLSKFFAKVERTEDGCWNWTGERINGGYGRIYLGWTGQRHVRAMAHRWAYERLIGPVPDGLELDHLCRNTACCNPEHLEPVTSRENNRRSQSPAGRNHAKVRCVRDHPLFGENLYMTPNGRRQCRRCRAEASARNRGA